MFSFNSQMSNKEDNKEFSIQITTDNYEQYRFIQDMARECVDGKHKESKLSYSDWLKSYEENPYDITPTNNFLNEACKTCPTHTSNGGSGICHCTLGLAPVSYSETIASTNDTNNSDNSGTVAVIA